MILQYQSSNGQVFDLKVGHIRTRTANYHTYNWKPQVIDQQYGARVYRFDKEAVAYESLLSIFGSLEERKQWLNILHSAFEHDIVNMTPGRITHGMYSIECYITMSNTYYEEPFTQNEITIYCPYPFWSRSTTHRLRNQGGEKEYPYLDFDYDFEYDFQAKLSGYASIQNEAVAPCDWEMVIYGPVTNPLVSIDGMIVGVYAVIGTGEKVVISSRDKTVKRIAGNAEGNLFNQRYKGNSIFERLPSGSHLVIWSGEFDVDITTYAERSEPPWI